MVADVIGQDFRHQGFETFIEPFVAGIENAMLFDQPARVADPQIAQYQITHAANKPGGGLQCKGESASSSLSKECRTMGINTERDIEANLQIGPTDQGMVRLFIEGQGIEIPMDFDPEEAEEIAEEIRAAAQAARAVKS